MKTKMRISTFVFLPWHRKTQYAHLAEIRRYLFLSLIAIVVMFLSVVPMNAQRHLYNRVELGAGNVWSFAGMTLISTIANQLAHRPITESTLRFCLPTTEYGNLNSYQGFEDWNHDKFIEDAENKSSNEDYIKADGRSLFSNIIVGDKIGYLSDLMGSVNYCIYGAAYYNLQQFKLMENSEDYTSICTQKIQLGGGLMCILGSIENSNRLILDAGLRYNIPIHFKGEGIDADLNDMMNKGISSHYMVKYSMGSSVAVGATVDIMHYNMFKDETLCGDRSKTVEFGITLSVLLHE